MFRIRAARAYRLFAEQTGSDREALVACILGARDGLTPTTSRRISVPVLVAVGSDDPGARQRGGLATLIPGAQAFTIPGRDHMKAVGDRAHKAAVLAFLSAAGDGTFALLRSAASLKGTL